MMELGIFSKKLAQNIKEEKFWTGIIEMENLHKVGGSNQRLRQAKSYLWKGLVDDAIAVFDDLKKKRCIKLCDVNDPASA